MGPESIDAVSGCRKPGLGLTEKLCHQHTPVQDTNTWKLGANLVKGLFERRSCGHCRVHNNVRDYARICDASLVKHDPAQPLKHKLDFSFAPVHTRKGG
jgi:hypothetical protein